jgi:alkylation response protein AidB-like acyl-CoA dehydrogenase
MHTREPHLLKSVARPGNSLGREAILREGAPALGFMASASKCYASDVSMEVTTDVVQLFGGAGYTQDFPVERMMRDAKITQIYEGTNQIQRVVMSRALLG